MKHPVRWFLCLAVLGLGIGPLWGQAVQEPTLFEGGGFLPNWLYQELAAPYGSESVNVYNGGLTVSAPLLPQAYPVNGNLSYNLQRVYNSKAAGLASWVGDGWTAGFGRVFFLPTPTRRNVYTYEPIAYALAPHFMDPAGGIHRLYPLEEGPLRALLGLGSEGLVACYVTRDNSWIRAEERRDAAGRPFWRVTMRDGTVLDLTHEVKRAWNWVERSRDVPREELSRQELGDCLCGGDVIECAEKIETVTYREPVPIDGRPAQDLRAGFHATLVRDVFGNRLEIAYEPDTEAIRRIVDEHGRETHFRNDVIVGEPPRLQCVLDPEGEIVCEEIGEVRALLQEVDAPAFGGGRAVFEHRYAAGDLLEEVWMPEGLSVAYAYTIAAEQVPGGPPLPVLRNPVLGEIRYPQGGRATYRYRNYAYRPGFTDAQERESTLVRVREVRVTGGSGVDYRWEWNRLVASQQSWSVNCAQSPTEPQPYDALVLVTDPAGNMTRYAFVAAFLSPYYGLPVQVDRFAGRTRPGFPTPDPLFARGEVAWVRSQASTFENDRFPPLLTPPLDRTDPTSVRERRNSANLRRTMRVSAREGFAVTDVNVRVRDAWTLYPDCDQLSVTGTGTRFDPSLLCRNQLGGSTRQAFLGVRVRQSGWNGLGNFERRRVDSTRLRFDYLHGVAYPGFVGTAATLDPVGLTLDFLERDVTTHRTYRTDYTPNPCTWVLDPWVFRERCEGADCARTEARFNPQGQVLTKVRRREAGGPLTPAAARAAAVPPGPILAPPFPAPPLLCLTSFHRPLVEFLFKQHRPLAAQPGDVVETYEYFTDVDGDGDLARGNLARRTTRGGDGGLPYTLEYDYQFGALERQGWTGVAWEEFTREIDVNTGLTARELDPSGFGTTYAYDALGRETRSVPDPTLGGAQEYPTMTRYSRPLDNLTVTLKGPALPDSPLASYDPAAPAGLADFFPPSDQYVAARTVSDGLGRAIRSERFRNDGGAVVRDSRYDFADQVVFQSEWVPRFPLPDVVAPPPGVPGAAYDYFFDFGGGAARRARDPLGRLRALTTADQQVHRHFYEELTTRLTIADVSGAPSTALTTTDVFGNVVEVDAPPGGADGRYRYDKLNNLTRAELVPDLASTDLPQVRAFTYDDLGWAITADHPEDGLTESLAYDAAGNLLDRRDARGRAEGYVLRHTYDAAQRLTAIDRRDDGGTGQPISQFTYDAPTSPYAPGNLTGSRSVQAGGIAIEMAYRYGGLSGRPSAATCTVTEPGGVVTAFRHRLAYNRLGLQATLEYPHLPALDGTFPAGGHLQRRTLQAGYRYGLLSTLTDSLGTTHLADVTYNPALGVQRTTFGNGTFTDVVPEVRNRPGAIQAGVAGGPLFFHSGTYAYDGAGNITEIGTLAEETAQLGLIQHEEYRYDPLSRLTYARLGHDEETYAYDRYGNLTDRFLNPAGLAASLDPGLPERLNLEGRSYAAATGEVDNRIHAPGYAYDANGNLARDPRGRYVYDALDRLVRVETAAGAPRQVYAYGADDRRCLTLDLEADTATFFLRDGSGQVVSEYARPLNSTEIPRGTKEYVYAHGALVGLHTACGEGTGDLRFEGTIVLEEVCAPRALRFSVPLSVASAPGFTGGVITFAAFDAGNALQFFDQRTPVAAFPMAADPTRFELQVLGAGLPVEQEFFAYAQFQFPCGVSPGSNELELFIVQGPGGCLEPPVLSHMTHHQPAPPSLHQTQFFHLDHLGSPRRVSADPEAIDADQSGTITEAEAVVAKTDFLPFGTLLPSGFDPTANTHLFTGHERDEATGLDYMMHRYYSAPEARFREVDPIPGDLADPQSLNRYAYTRNNPIKFIDPAGLVSTSPNAPKWMQGPLGWGPGGGLWCWHFKCANVNPGPGTGPRDEGEWETEVTSWTDPQTANEYMTVHTFKKKKEKQRRGNSRDGEGDQTDWVDYLETASNFAAGFGDTITFGGTRGVRSWTGADAVVDDTSGAYIWGMGTGYTWDAAFMPAGGAWAFSRGGFLNSNRYLRIGVGRHEAYKWFRISGNWIKRIKKSGHINIFRLGKWR